MPRPPRPGDPLTARETLIVTGLANGGTDPRIAADAAIAAGALAEHLAVISLKLGARQRAAIVGRCHRLGYLTAPQAPASAALLDPRGRSILEAISHGRTFRQIASDFAVSHDQVRALAQSAYKQLGARDGAHAVHLAYRLGLLTADGEAPGGDATDLRAVLGVAAGESLTCADFERADPGADLERHRIAAHAEPGLRGELRRRREAAGLTRRQAAALTPWSYGKLGGIETGHTGVSAADVRTLIDAYRRLAERADGGPTHRDGPKIP